MARMAILRIVGDEVRDRGACELTLAEIAARAGSCRTMARTTLRQAAERGLVLIEERRRPGSKNLPNRVRIISAEWRSWLKRGVQNVFASVLAALEAIGGKRTPPTDTNSSLTGENRTQHTRCNGSGGMRRAPRPMRQDGITVPEGTKRSSTDVSAAPDHLRSGSHVCARAKPRPTIRPAAR